MNAIRRAVNAPQPANFNQLVGNDGGQNNNIDMNFANNEENHLIQLAIEENLYANNHNMNNLNLAEVHNYQQEHDTEDDTDDTDSDIFDL